MACIAQLAAIALRPVQPAALAKWIDALGIKGGMRVYHLGCGAGYFTAIMAEMVGRSGSVVASEIDAELAARASKNLSGYANVSVHSGDGADFDPGECDAMLINAGVTHPHPLWLDRLSPGGSLVLPITVSAGMGMGANLGKGVMVKIGRQENGFSAKVVTFVAIYSCLGMRDTQMEQALGKAMGTGKLFKLRSLRRDVHEPADSCLVRGAELDQLVLSKIDPDGALHPTVIEAKKMKQPLSAPASVIAPTDAITTDNKNGILVSVKQSRGDGSETTDEAADEFVYRVNQDGELVFRFQLPKYSGSRKDDMVIGENNVAFATRGKYLILRLASSTERNCGVGSRTNRT
jgi:protein-L-isoaspartate O-methyltransferase